MLFFGKKSVGGWLYWVDCGLRLAATSTSTQEIENLINTTKSGTRANMKTKLPPSGSYPAFWLSVHRALSNQERDAFNDWRDDIRQRLEETTRHASALAALCEGTTVEAHAKQHAQRAKEAECRFVGTVPVLVRLFGQHAT